MTNKERFDSSFADEVAAEWKNINWDAIQRRRFINADAEIPHEDSMTETLRKKKDDV